MISLSKKSFAIIIAALLLTSCAQPPWVMINKEKRTVSTDSFKVSLPTGWMHAASVQGYYTIKRDKDYEYLRVDRVAVTLDGFYLEDIEFIRFNTKDALPYLKREYTGNMLPSELAELYISDLKKSGLEAITVEKNEPAIINGKQGFKLLLTRKNSRGLKVNRLIYGFGHKSGFYVMSYEAPNLYYYPTHLASFTESLNSFRMIEQK